MTSEEGHFDSRIMSIEDIKFNNRDYSLKEYYTPKDGELITEIDIFKKYNIIYLDREGVI